MALTDIVSRTREILYGSVIGEKPPIRIAASNANESTSGPKVTFTLDSGEGNKVKAGHILSTRGASALTGSYVLYVLSVATDTVTALNGYEGPSVTGSDSGDLDNMVFEQNAPVTEYSIIKHIEQITDSFLYPHVTKVAQASLTPDLSDYQNEIPAVVERIRSCWQVIGGEAVQLPFDLEKNLNSTLSSTGSLAYIGAIDGTTVYYTYDAKYLSSDTLGEDIEYLIALGAAALAAGGQVPESQMASASKDSQMRGQRDVSSTLWRDFITVRTSISEYQTADDLEYFEIYR